MNEEHNEDLYDLIDDLREEIIKLKFNNHYIMYDNNIPMSNFTTKTFMKYDDYMTPKYAWEDIKQYIPKDKVIWEAFYGDGTSGTHLTDLGFTRTIHQPLDFFKNNIGEIVVSNPPFSLCEEVLVRLKELNKPFILIMPSSKINTKYFRNIFIDVVDKDPIQIIIPRKRINFVKTINGVIPKNYKSACNFDCFYYCWKIGLEKDIIWLDMDKKKENKEKKIRKI